MKKPNYGFAFSSKIDDWNGVNSDKKRAEQSQAAKERNSRRLKKKPSSQMSVFLLKNSELRNVR